MVDIGYAAVPIIMIGNCGPFPTLVKQKPLRHLLSFLPLFSVITFLIIQTATYVIIWEWMKTLDWYVRSTFWMSRSLPSHRSFMLIFTVYYIQYI